MAKILKPPKPVIYRHTSHADWGLCMIVEETASRIYLAFENAGRRPFLNQERYRELLVPAELEAGAGEEIVARISRNAAKLANKPADKKPKKKAAVAKPEEEDAVEAVPEAADEEADEEE